MTLTRRSLIAGAALAGPIALSTPATAAIAATPAGSNIALLHSRADVAYVASRVTAGSQPWVDGWNRLQWNGRSAATWQPRPLVNAIRGGAGDNVAQMFIDIHAAYQNALRWRIAGDGAHGDAAVRILNAWSRTMTSLSGNADRFLASGLYGYQWANAAQLVRDHPGFDVEAFRALLLNVFHPMADQFLTSHNNAVITNYWANWDLSNMAAILAIGIFAEREDLVTRAVGYFETGAGNGSILHAVPYVYDDQGLAQWQESGRDQGHSVMGIGLMGAFCEMAWNHGIDSYGSHENRFLKAAEYVAKYNLGQDVPFTPYTWQSGPNTIASHVGWNTQTVVSAASRGHVRPVWELILGHYVGRRGIAAPYVQQIAQRLRAEGGGGDYGSASGGYDQLGFGTLLHSARTVPVAVESTNYPGRFIAVDSGALRLVPSTASTPSAQFFLRSGRAQHRDGAVSLESVSAPGTYVRHSDFVARLSADDGTALTAADSTFILEPGLADPTAVSFRSSNYPERYLRHSDYGLRIDPALNGLDRSDATFSLR